MRTRKTTRKTLASTETEASIQRAVAKYLDTLGFLWCHVPNEGKRRVRTGANLKSQGLKRGVPDVLIFEQCLQAGEDTPRVGLALELKTPDGKTKPEQLVWLEELQRCGWRAEIARGTDEALSIIRECYGSKTRRRTKSTSSQ